MDASFQHALEGFLVICLVTAVVARELPELAVRPLNVLEHLEQGLDFEAAEHLYVSVILPVQDGNVVLSLGQLPDFLAALVAVVVEVGVAAHLVDCIGGVAAQITHQAVLGVVSDPHVSRVQRVTYYQARNAVPPISML